MAVLISPSNNSGWGLGVKGMYGGSKYRSLAHPVLVKRHYRAKWGTVSGRKAVEASNTIDEAIDSVVRAAASSAGKRRRRRRRAILLPRADIAFLTRRRMPRLKRTRRLVVV